MTGDKKTRKRPTIFFQAIAYCTHQFLSTPHNFILIHLCPYEIETLTSLD